MVNWVDSAGSVGYKSILIAAAVIFGAFAGLWWYLEPPAEGTPSGAIPAGEVQAQSPRPNAPQAAYQAEQKLAGREQAAPKVMVQAEGARPVEVFDGQLPDQLSGKPMAPPAGENGFTVQVGAYGSEESATQRVDALRDKGYQAFVSLGLNGSEKVFRVCIGKYPSRAEAVDSQSRLKSEGVESFVRRIS